MSQAVVLMRVFPAKHLVCGKQTNKNRLHIHPTQNPERPFVSLCHMKKSHGLKEEEDNQSDGFISRLWNNFTIQSLPMAFFAMTQTKCYPCHLWLVILHEPKANYCISIVCSVYFYHCRKAQNKKKIPYTILYKYIPKFPKALTVSGFFSNSQAICWFGKAM